MKDRLATLVRRYVPWMAIDALIVVVGFYAALIFRFFAVPAQALAEYLAPLNRFILPIILLYVTTNVLWQLDRRVWRYASAQEVISIFLATSSSTVVAIIVDLLLGAERPRPLPLSVIMLGGFFTFSGFVMIRYRSRLISGFRWRWRALQGEFPGARTRTLIYGAGEAGQILAWRLLHQKEGKAYEVVGFVDDNPAIRGLRVHGIKVLGSRRELAMIVKREEVALIILAMSSVTGEERRAIVSACQETPAKIKIIPNVFDWMAHSNGAPLLREVNVEDLLGRKPATVDQAACARVIADKSVLITGGCGSIGSELCRRIAMLRPRLLLVLDNNESGLYDLEIELRARFPGLNLRAVVGDVTDERKMALLFAAERPQVIFHVAAYKHVPLMEQYPEEAIRVNIRGSQVTVETALRYGAERFVLVSTDKAINPRSVMGATKRVAEMVVLHAARSSNCRCTVVRFGNVLGSRGSVVPTFAKQIELGGPVTVTHPEATRFFMEISEAASLIVQAASLTTGGDAFMLDMGERIRVDDLARRMIRMRGLRPGIDIPIVYTGMRPGEKLHEELYGNGEQKEPTPHPLVFRIRANGHGIPSGLLEQVDRLMALAREGRQEDARWELLSLAWADRASESVRQADTERIAVEM
ncbi:MAG: polysaccharide biosynthesis protein [Chloroflexi bacterium]|nr:polysaccharide biosynthesis protein [Chloroflexota bacterium]